MIEAKNIFGLIVQSLLHLNITVSLHLSLKKIFATPLTALTVCITKPFFYSLVGCAVSSDNYVLSNDFISHINSLNSTWVAGNQIVHCIGSWSLLAIPKNVHGRVGGGACYSFCFYYFWSHLYWGLWLLITSLNVVRITFF